MGGIAENSNFKGPLFIVFEGIDGSGKGTQCDLLFEKLQSICNNGTKIKKTAEPTNRKVGRIIRDSMSGKIRISGRSLALLFAADRSEHIEKMIKPALDNSDILITDRYVYSSLAYQGLVSDVDVQWICNLNRFAIPPDLVVTFFVPTDVAVKRIISRNKKNKEFFEEMYFFLDHANSFFRELGQKELKIDFYKNYKVKRPPNFFNTSFLLVDGTLSIEDIHSQILTAVDELLKTPVEERPSFKWLEKSNNFTKQMTLEEIL